MTATRDRQRDSQQDHADLEEWGQRSAFGTAKGWPWWAAVPLALVLSLIGGIVDMHVSGGIGKVFEGAYFLGCVGAVCLVRRRNLFGPMVQAPLILAAAIPAAVVISKGMPSGSGTMSKLIALGVPLITGFPVMAITTGATVVIGGIRFLVQRKPVGDDGNDDADRLDRRDERRRPPSRDGERRREVDGRQRQGGSGRPDRVGSARDDRASSGRDDRGGARDRGRSQPPARSRSEARERGSRSASERSSGSSRERERGPAPRSGGQSKDRGQTPRGGGRPARDEGRRQPPRRRDDDY